MELGEIVGITSSRGLRAASRDSKTFSPLSDTVMQVVRATLRRCGFVEASSRGLGPRYCLLEEEASTQIL